MDGKYTIVKEDLKQVKEFLEQRKKHVIIFMKILFLWLS